MIGISNSVPFPYLSRIRVDRLFFVKFAVSMVEHGVSLSGRAEIGILAGEEFRKKPEKSSSHRKRFATCINTVNMLK